VAEEIAYRAQTRIQQCVHRADSPFLKTIDEYDFTFQSAIRLSLLGSARSSSRRPLAHRQRAERYQQDAPGDRNAYRAPTRLRSPMPLERGRHPELRGRSDRTRHSPLDLSPTSETPSAAPARLSGNRRPEFRELTDVAPNTGGSMRSVWNAAGIAIGQVLFGIDARDPATSLRARY
jgi:hypothetical protein